MSEEIEIKDEVLDLKVTDKYDENQIQVLEGLEAVRKRPGMYIGSTSARGLHHLVYEIVDNSIDEALAGYCTHIEVTIEKGDIIRVFTPGAGGVGDPKKRPVEKVLQDVRENKVSREAAETLYGVCITEKENGQLDAVRI